MKFIKITLLFFLALLLALVDTSVLSFFPVFEATILLSVSTLIVLSLLGYKREAVYFAGFSAIFYAAFSSMPVYFVVIFFLAMPFLISYLKTKAFFEGNIYLSVLVFLISFFLFGLIFFILEGDLSKNSLLVLFSFMIVNTLSGIIVYFVIKIFMLKLSINRQL